jgi:hypothetical protein
VAVSSLSAPSQLQRNNIGVPAPMAGMGAAGILRGVIAIKFGGLLQLGDAGSGVMAAAAWTQESPQASDSSPEPPHSAPQCRKAGTQAERDFFGNWMPLGAMARLFTAYESEQPGRPLRSEMGNRVRRRELQRNSSQMMFALTSGCCHWNKRLLAWWRQDGGE